MFITNNLIAKRFHFQFSVDGEVLMGSPRSHILPTHFQQMLFLRQLEQYRHHVLEQGWVPPSHLAPRVDPPILS